MSQQRHFLTQSDPRGWLKFVQAKRDIRGATRSRSELGSCCLLALECVTEARVPLLNQGDDFRVKEA